jgi:poly(3-hydroxybutyrate) depolymerase
VPILHVHGTSDAAVPFHGGQSPISWVLGVTFPSVEDALDRIGGAEGCVGAPRTTGDGSVRVTEWTGCEGGVPLRLVALDGVTHEWPRGRRYDATEEILDFFGISA